MGNQWDKLNIKSIIDLLVIFKSLDYSLDHHNNQIEFNFCLKLVYDKLAVLKIQTRQNLTKKFLLKKFSAIK